VTPLRQRVLDELQRHNYSPATSRGYIHAIKCPSRTRGKLDTTRGGEGFIRRRRGISMRAPVPAVAGNLRFCFVRQPSLF
jgi:hypothetical protein